MQLCSNPISTMKSTNSKSNDFKKCYSKNKKLLLESKQTFITVMNKYEIQQVILKFNEGITVDCRWESNDGYISFFLDYNDLELLRNSTCDSCSGEQTENAFQLINDTSFIETINRLKEINPVSIRIDTSGVFYGIGQAVSSNYIRNGGVGGILIVNKKDYSNTNSLEKIDESSFIYEDIID